MRAAERLNLAQPALSQLMKNPEAELGATLFVRGRRQSVLTAAGRELLPRAEVLLAQAAAARHAVAEVAGLRGGRLVIASIPSVSAGWVPDAIRGFRAAWPKVELCLMEESSAGVARLEESGRAELGLIQTPVDETRFDQRRVLVEPFVVLLPPRHPLAERRSLRLEKLATENFIFYKGRAKDSALVACREAGFEPRIACESGQLETIRALVGAGLGVAILPRLAARDPLGEERAVRLSHPLVRRTVALISLRQRAMSPAAAEFTRHITRQTPDRRG